MKKSQTKPIGGAEAFVSFGLLLFLWIYPFFLPNRYFKMTIGKTFFFYGATAVFALGCLLLRAADRKKKTLLPRRRDITDLFLALFLFVAAVSCAASEYRIDSFTGNTGR